MWEETYEGRRFLDREKRLFQVLLSQGVDRGAANDMMVAKHSCCPCRLGSGAGDAVSQSLPADESGVSLVSPRQQPMPAGHDELVTLLERAEVVARGQAMPFRSLKVGGVMLVMDPDDDPLPGS